MEVTLEIATLQALASSLAVSKTDAARRLGETGLRAEDFADTECAKVFALLAILANEGRAVDAVAMAQTLRGQVSRELVVAVATANEPGALAERARALKESAQRRRAVDALTATLAMLRNGNPLVSSLAEARKAIEALSVGGDGTRLATEDFLALLDHLDEVQRGHRPPVLPTGIHALDASIGGLQRTLTVIGALPGVGKSALLASIVRNLLADGRRVGFFSLEDEGQWLTRRLVSELARVPLFVLGNRPLGSYQMERVGEAAEHVNRLLERLVISDQHGHSAADIVAKAREMVLQHRCECVFVDHLGEIRLNRSDRHDLDIAEALSELRGISKAHRVPVVVACHVKRRDGLSPTEEPRLTDFAFSAGVERMARVALALSRPDEDRLAVSVLKQTQGQAGMAVEVPFLAASGLVGNGEPLERDAYAEQEAEMMRGGR